MGGVGKSVGEIKRDVGECGEGMDVGVVKRGGKGRKNVGEVWKNGCGEGRRYEGKCVGV